MANCSVFICPTLADYHPIVLVEAQALGKPVISTKVGAIPEIVSNGKTGLLVEPGDEAELANAITTLLSDNRTLSEFSKMLKNKPSSIRSSPPLALLKICIGSYCIRRTLQYLEVLRFASKMVRIDMRGGNDERVLDIGCGSGKGFWR